MKRKHGAQNRAHIFQELTLEGVGLCVCVGGVRIITSLALALGFCITKAQFQMSFVSGPEMFTQIYLTVN